MEVTMRRFELGEKQKHKSPVVSGPPASGEEVILPMGLTEKDLPFQVRIGEAFNDTPLRTYGTTKWRVAWWREGIQNSVDAGSGHIWLGYVQTSEQLYEASVEDDGSGMDREALLGRFLALGETGKGGYGYGATGGFGKAKELLLLPWVAWEIQSASRDTGGIRIVRIQGRGTQHTEPTESFMDAAEARRRRADQGYPTAKITGTLLRVWMGVDPRKPDGIDRRTQLSDAEVVLERSYLPGIKFYVNGNLRSAEEEINRPPRKRPVRTWDVFGEGDSSGLRAAAKIYAKKGASLAADEIFVRQNGLYMFSLGPRPEGINGRVTVECSGSAKLLFTDNRQSFTDPYEGQIDAFIREMEVEGEYALKPKLDPVNTIYQGEDLVSEHDPTMLAIEEQLRERYNDFEGRALKKLEADKDRGSPATPSNLDDLRMSPSEVTTLIRVVQRAQEFQKQTGDPEVPVRMWVDAEDSQVALSTLPIQATPQVFLNNMMWRPRFLVRSEVGTLIVPSAYQLGDEMTYYARCLLHFWSEVCRWVCISLGISLDEVGSGFLFDWDESGREAIAEYLEQSGRFYISYEERQRVNVPRGKWLLVNPVKAEALAKNQFGDPVAFKLRPRYRLSNRDDQLRILASAIHEVTHLEGYFKHNPTFAYALTQNIVVMPRVVPFLQKTVKRVREIYKDVKVKRATFEVRPPTPGRRKRKGGRDERLPAAGELVSREYRDTTYILETTNTNAVVLVDPYWDMEYGFSTDYKGRPDPGKVVRDNSGMIIGRRYPSISALARMITTKDTNGYRFFGLGD